MFSMARPFRGHVDLQALLPLLAAMAVLTLLGHFVVDAADLWPRAIPLAASNSDFKHAGGGRQDAASTLHTGFAVAFVATTAAPVVLSVIQIWTYPQPQYRLFSPPFLPPKAH